MQRRLAAIMVADIVAYSSLMEDAEEHTADRAAHCLQVIQGKVTSLGGRVFNTAGDACLAEFGSAINALRCAAEIRNTLAGGPEDDPLRLRFGLHLADVVVRGNDLVGDGVNVATRIQQEAEPDSICISGVFFDNIRRNSPFAFDDLGERRFKNCRSRFASIGFGRRSNAAGCNPHRPEQRPLARSAPRRLQSCRSGSWVETRTSGSWPTG
jgi:class 3 adenylate cyclase